MKVCDMWTLAGNCADEIVRAHAKTYEPSCCNVCGNQNYNHMNMEQLHEHMHRNPDIMEEHMLRSWMKFECENKVKEAASAKPAADAKATSEKMSKVTAAAADAKKCIYISRLDELHTKKRLDREKTSVYFRDTFDVLMHTQPAAHRNNTTKLAVLKQLETYDIADKIALLLASGLPALIKNIQQPSRDDDQVMALVRMSAANMKSLWRVPVISTLTVMRFVNEEDLVLTAQDVRSVNKRTGNVHDGERSRHSKKFKANFLISHCRGQ